MSDLKIIRIANSAFCFDKEQLKWYALSEGNGEYCDLENDKCLVTVLKILEGNADFFYEKLESDFLEQGLPTNLIRSFPLKRIIIFCIANHMIYWLKLSLSWLKYVQADEEFKGLVNDIQKEKYPQDIKHALLKFIANK